VLLPARDCRSGSKLERAESFGQPDDLVALAIVCADARGAASSASGRRYPVGAFATVVRAGTLDAAGVRPLAINTLHDGSPPVREVGDAFVRRAELRVGRLTLGARPFDRTGRTVPTTGDHHRRHTCGDASEAAPSRSRAYSKPQRHDAESSAVLAGRLKTFGRRSYTAAW
jgi:hypothetical protein